MNNTYKSAMAIAIAALASGGNMYNNVCSFECELTLPKHGEPNSRPEHIKERKKDVKRKKRARINKRGY